MYIWIGRAGDYTQAYFARHDAYQRTGVLAFRDAYFVRGDYDKANAWEADLPVKSPDFLNLRGCSDLSFGGKDDVATGSHAVQDGIADVDLALELPLPVENLHPSVLVISHVNVPSPVHCNVARIVEQPGP